MNRYRLALAGDPPIHEKSGYVFCADLEAAQADAQTLLDAHPACAVVRIYDGNDLVCEVGRGPGRAEAAE